MSQILRTRIAPTPSGLLHPGNGLSFIMTWAIARAAGGSILLRIDDLDRARCREDYVADIFETLEWLGIDYDEGPGGVDDFFKNWSQQARFGLYEAALARLREQGQLFACRCSRREIREASPDGRYPGSCISRKLDFEASGTAWRVRAPAAGQSVRMNRWQHPTEVYSLEVLDDFVVRRKNKAPAYQIASLLDDQHFDINFVVRGSDLFDSTLAQLYLAHLLSQKKFLDTTFWHHTLLTGEDGEKLSKSKGAGSLREWRQQGVPKGPLYQQAGQLLRLAQICTRPEDIVRGLKEKGQAPTSDV